MNCINCGQDLGTVEKIATCPKCRSVIHRHYRNSEMSLVTVFAIDAPSPSVVEAFRKTLERLYGHKGESYLVWKSPLEIHQFDIEA